MKKPKKKMNVGKQLVQRTKNLTEHMESVMMQRESGQTKLTYFGQHFHLSLVSGDRNPTMIISNTEETNNHVVSIDRYELKDVADFIYNYLEKNNDFLQN
jgi:hypothetical protein